MIDFIQTGGPYSDGTSTYNVRINRDFTVKDFIDYILKEFPENWGYINIADKDYVLSNQSEKYIEWDRFHYLNCNYKNGNIILKALDSFTLSKKVVSVKASGNRTRMDYIIGIEKETINELPCR